MARPNADIEVDPHDIEAWYFFPYTEAGEYTPDDPLYSVVAVFEDFGDVMVYDRPGDAGAFHSVDPEQTTAEAYPPSDAFKTALAMVLSNPGEPQDITDFVAEMEPWEHHYLEVLLTGANESPELLPVEVRAFINTVLDEKLRLEIDEDADKTAFTELVEEEGEQFLRDLRNPEQIAQEYQD